jgi:phosphoglycolate phosphatase
MRFNTILFDLDGTIFDSAEGISESVKYAAEKLGIFVPDAETRKKFVGPPLRQSFKKYCGVNDDTAELALSAYREYYSTRGVYMCRPYDGIEKLFIYLKDNGYNLYVATAKPTEYTKIMLEKYSYTKYFKDIVGASMDKSMDSKEKIIRHIVDKLASREKTVMIGDTEYDILGAKANGISSIAVTYGYGSYESLKSAGADYFAGTVEEIYKYLT